MLNQLWNLVEKRKLDNKKNSQNINGKHHFPNDLSVNVKSRKLKMNVYQITN